MKAEQNEPLPPAVSPPTCSCLTGSLPAPGSMFSYRRVSRFHFWVLSDVFNDAPSPPHFGMGAACSGEGPQVVGGGWMCTAGSRAGHPQCLWSSSPASGHTPGEAGHDGGSRGLPASQQARVCGGPEASAWQWGLAAWQRHGQNGSRETSAQY